MCQKKGLLLIIIAGDVFNVVKNNVYKSLFVLFGLVRLKKGDEKGVVLLVLFVKPKEQATCIF